jgi:hypothetical protein
MVHILLLVYIITCRDVLDIRYPAGYQLSGILISGYIFKVLKLNAVEKLQVVIYTVFSCFTSTLSSRLPSSTPWSEVHLFTNRLGLWNPVSEPNPVMCFLVKSSKFGIQYIPMHMLFLIA